MERVYESIMRRPEIGTPPGPLSEAGGTVVEVEEEADAEVSHFLDYLNLLFFEVLVYLSYPSHECHIIKYLC